MTLPTGDYLQSRHFLAQRFLSFSQFHLLCPTSLLHPQIPLPPPPSLTHRLLEHLSPQRFIRTQPAHPHLPFSPCFSRIVPEASLTALGSPWLESLEMNTNTPPGLDPQVEILFSFWHAGFAQVLREGGSCGMFPHCPPLSVNSNLQAQS